MCHEGGTRGGGFCHAGGAREGGIRHEGGARMGGGGGGGAGGKATLGTPAYVIDDLKLQCSPHHRVLPRATTRQPGLTHTPTHSPIEVITLT